MPRYVPTAADLAAETARKHRSGRWMTIVGVALVLLAVACLLVAGSVVAGGDEADGYSGAMLGMLAGPPVLMLAAICVAIPGEQLRRGSIRLATPEDGARGQVVSEFRMLGLGWHVLWVLAGVLVAGAFIVGPQLVWAAGSGWPLTRADPDGGWMTVWVIWGALGLGCAAAGLASVVKKSVWIAGGRRGDARPGTDRTRRFWRFVTYRWRFDLWLAGLGGALLGISGTILPYASDPDATAGFRADHALGFGIVVGVGALLLVVGVGLATQFRRSGELLTTAEGV